MNQPAATPRTDAAWAASFSPERATFSVRDECEKLERELAAAKAELAIAENWVEHHSKHADDLIGENVRLRALFPEILAALRNGAGCTADVSVGFLESVPNEVASVVTRLRTEVERWKTVATQMTAEREHNANEASRLRAELATCKDASEALV
jgi:predicted  nucleic acid-binding Zn-ribbon protein